jgi:CubicO group peptidase (beta-lactamase class C family)
MKKTLKLISFWFLIPILALAVTAFSLTLVVRYPNPVAAYQLAQSVPSEQPDLMPTHVIPASVLPHQWQTATQSEALPETVEFEGESYVVEDLLRATATKALLIIRDGVITYEEYSEDFSQNELINTMSIGKTMVGMAIGNLIADGLIREQEPV